MAGRSATILRDRVSLVWLMAAVVVAVAHRQVPESTWLLVHLVLLGALTHAALVWSTHFALTLTRAAVSEAAQRRQTIRVAGLALGTLVVIIALPLGYWPAVLVGGVLVGASVGWHGIALWLLVRRALPGRFRITIGYYRLAAASLLVGVTCGVLLARGPSGSWHGRLLVAHTGANLLGWIGLTVTGTLVTLWPTMLRTRMDARAERLATQALPILVTGVGVTVAGALLDLRPRARGGLARVGAGVLWWGRALLGPLRAAPPRDFAPASVAAALVWAVVGLVRTGVLLARSTTWAEVSAGFPSVAGLVASGFAVQLLTGALSYLMPVMLGGGPALVKTTQAWFNRYGGFRLVSINGGLLLFWLPVPGWVRASAAAVVLVSMMIFLVLLGGAVRARRIGLDPDQPRPAASRQRPSIWTGNQLIAATTALAVAASVGVALQAGTPDTTAGTATGQITEVRVVAQQMRFQPASVSVPRGNRLVVELVNEDPTTTHDLQIGPARTSRLAPGHSERLDAGVITESTQGWCTVAGHREMGMVLDVVVPGAAASTPAATTGHDHGHQHSAPVTAGSGLPRRVVDPALAPLSGERVRRVSLTVSELPLEVAPGVWQKRWTYNGGPVGPVLHGRVGDRFEITLVNDGTIGHSIDFHAGALAPDQPMRTIAPGQRLEYVFTATRAGIWMYHCSTAPMSVHIAAGMHGVVVIEPDDLAPVDRSYVLVQSEVFLGAGSASADTATEIDTAKVRAQTPDLVVFNGVGFQYDRVPFQARVGQRVRFWALAAGPNRALSFHIVGGQFDTVWTEGSYTLRPGRTGAQVLPLLAAQGGFVELAFPEAGNYPVVNHVMGDAERGAKGVVQVS